MERIVNRFDKSIDYPHNRYNPLLDEWILVCPHRSKRPWMGQIERPETSVADKQQQQQQQQQQTTKEKNPLAPGATRSSGLVNANYTSTYVFYNDFPALLDEDQEFVDNSPEPVAGDVAKVEEDELFRIEPARGRCRVMCFHADSHKTLALMTVEEIVLVIEAWIAEMKQLGSKYDWIQIFENKGSMMGCSNPHPHCQIWASRFLPNIPRKKHQTQRDYMAKHGTPMLWDYLQKELRIDERIILKNDHWLVLVPFWAVWPFETMILPHQRRIQRLDDLVPDERNALASIMKRLLVKYDNLFQTSFPYSMAWHGAPTGPHIQEDQSHWILHAVYFPPLLRSATIKKYMVGYELSAQCQRDITPEKAAEILRQASEEHYLKSI